MSEGYMRMHHAIISDLDDEYIELRLWLLRKAAAQELMDVARAAKLHPKRLQEFYSKSDSPLAEELNRLRDAYNELEPRN